MVQNLPRLKFHDNPPIGDSLLTLENLDEVYARTREHDWAEVCVLNSNLKRIADLHDPASVYQRWVLASRADDSETKVIPALSANDFREEAKVRDGCREP